MAQGINISVGADTRDFASGVSKGIVEPLEDVQDTFKRTASAGDQAGDQLEGSFRGAQAATDEYRRDYERMSDQVRDASRRTGRQLGDDIEHGARDASEAVGTAKENIGSNLKEVAASFDGSAQGLADGFQGLAAEVAEGFGPGGLVAGAILAGGIGIISTQLGEADEKSETVRQHIADLASQLIETGSEGKIALSGVVDQLKTLATSTDPSEQSLVKLSAIARQAGASYSDLASAYAGNSEGLGDLIRNEQNHAKALSDQANGLRTVVRGTTEDIAGKQKASTATSTYLSTLKDAKRVTDAAAEAQRAYNEAGGPALQRTADATEAYASSVADSLHSAGEDWKDYQTKQGINLDKYNDHLEDSVKATENYKKNVVKATSSLTQDALNYILSLGEEAAPLLQQYVDAPNKLRDRTASNWDRLGKASGSAYTTALAGAVPDAIDGPTIRAPKIEAPDLVGLVGGMQAYLDAHPLRAGAVAVTRYGKPLY